MPCRLPLSAQAFRRLFKEPYVCTSCLLRAPPRKASQQSTRGTATTITFSALTSPRNEHPRSSRTGNIDIPFKRIRSSRRHASSHGSVASGTAINAPTAVPPEYRELYRSLSGLQEAASSYVNLARLRLAINSLESRSPVVRVAFLGLGDSGPQAARKLARALLSDALGEEACWETEMLATIDGGASLLLRYGDADEATESNALVKTMKIPSRFLAQNNLEILVSAFNADQSLTALQDTPALGEGIVVPVLTTQNSEGGRVGFVRYPVHKAVVVTEGVAGAIEYGKVSSVLKNDDIVNAAIGVTLRRTADITPYEEQGVPGAVAIDLANHALDLFRASKANGAQFSEEWQTSRIPVLSQWITGPKRQPSSGINPAIQNLLSSILSSTAASVSQSEAVESAVAASTTVPEVQRASLLSAIKEWSAEAHRDLQTNLDAAFSSASSWRRTAWWRLFWRIDEVTISASDVLRRSWLTEAEPQLAFLCGRISEAGLATTEQLQCLTPQLLGPARREKMEEYERDKAQTETVAELVQMPSLLARIQQQSGVNPQFDPPWPQTINLSRQYMLRTLVPDLHRKAQALMFTTLTTIGGSAALGAWFYVATAGLALYESGAIVSLGLVWALRRLQKKWGEAREAFASTVREDARRVLSGAATHLHRTVTEGGRAGVKAEDVEDWREARDAIARCDQELEKLLRSG